MLLPYLQSKAELIDRLKTELEIFTFVMHFADMNKQKTFKTKLQLFYQSENIYLNYIEVYDGIVG